jgi:general secretion pathway protein G
VSACGALVRRGTRQLMSLLRPVEVNQRFLQRYTQKTREGKRGNMPRRRVGPITFQACHACLIDAQARQQRGCARCRRHALEKRLGIYFPVAPLETGAPLHRARSHGGKRAAGQRGFSLIELLIVVGIILTLAALSIPSMLAAIDAAKLAKAIGDIHTMEVDIVTYQVGNDGALPHSLADFGRGDMLDPWGTPYQYLNIADDPLLATVRLDRFLHPFNSDYDLYSMGKDKLSLPAIDAAVSADDVIRANDGQYVGLASQF